MSYTIEIPGFITDDDGNFTPVQHCSPWLQERYYQLEKSFSKNVYDSLEDEDYDDVEF